MFSCLATSFCIGTNVFSPLLSQMLHIITKQNIPSLHSPTHWCTKSTGPGFGVFEAHTFLVHGTSSSRPLQKTWQVGSLGHGHGQGLLGCFFFFADVPNVGVFFVIPYAHCSLLQVVLEWVEKVPKHRASQGIWSI